MASSKGSGKEVAHFNQPGHSRGHNLPLDLPSTGFVRNSSSSPVEPPQDYPLIDPGILEIMRSHGIKLNRQFIRPVEPSSFSPQSVEDYVREAVGKFFKPEWKEMEDVTPEIFTSSFEYFIYKTKWTPDDDESILSCFRNKCAEIMKERRLPIPVGKTKQGPTHSSKDMGHVEKPKRVPNQLNREDLDQQEYYSHADPAGEAHSKIKRARREKFACDQNLHGGNITSGHGRGELKNEHGKDTHVRELSSASEDASDETSPGELWKQFWENYHETMVYWSDAPDKMQDPWMVHQVSILAEEIKNEMMDLVNANLPSIVRNVIRRQRF